MNPMPDNLPARRLEPPRPAAKDGPNLIWFVLPLFVITGLGYLVMEGYGRLQRAESETARLRQQLTDIRETVSPDTALDAQRRLLQPNPVGTPTVTGVKTTGSDMATPQQIESENILKLQADNKRLEEQSRALATRKQELAIENTVLKDQLAKNAIAVAPSLSAASGVPAAAPASPTASASPMTSASPTAPPPGSSDESLRMGATASRDGLFGPVEPVRSVVLSRRPRLRWNPMPGVTSYQVRLESVGSRLEVLATERVSKNEWRIPDTLDRGKTYRWTLLPLGDRNVPARAASPAYFTVASSADARLMAGSTLEYARRMIALHRNDVAEPLLSEVAEGAADLPQAQEAAKLRDSLNR